MPAPLTYATLQLDPAPVTGTEPITVTGTWYRVVGSLDVLVGSGLTYVVQREDMGFGLFVRQRASSIYGTVTADAVTTDPVEGAPEYYTSTVIAGDEQAGGLLTATEGDYYAWPAASLTWQWLRDGAPIGGATAATYSPVGADVGTLLSVESTRTNARGADTSTSAETGPIAAASLDALLLEDDVSYLLQEDGFRILL